MPSATDIAFSNMASKYNIGDLVWAKMKGFSPWPAKIVEPTKEVKRPTLKKPMHCVFFFGTDNYAWVQEDLIKPYEENKEQHLRPNKSGSFKEAVEAIEDYVRNRPKLKTTTDKEIPKTNSTVPKPKIQKDLKDHNEKVEKKEIQRRDKKRKDETNLSYGPAAVKRTSSDSSSTSSLTNKRPRPTDKVVGASNLASSIYTFTEASSSAGADHSHHSYVNSSPSKSSGLLVRPAYVPRPVTPPLDIECMSETLRQKNVKASNLKFGFLGLGIMGRGIVKNLLNSGHHVTVWNRTPSKCRDFVKAGAVKGQTPADVVAAADITFCCVSDPQAAKEMVFGNCGVLQEIRTKKGYVEMTSIDPETSQDIAEAILTRGGRYLEASLSGSKVPAEEGALIILAAGERSLFNDCATCFQAMGKHAFYLGEVGNGSKMNLIINMVLGTALAGLAEAMALADRAGLSQRDLLEIMELGSLNCPAIIEKGKAIIEGTFPTNMPLQHMQKDLSLALGLGDQLEQPLPLTAAANEVYKHAKRLSYGEHDVSSVYLRARF
ncbi:cytokine-like nuclear factor N-PAC isoform X2 [Centruroides vittatus]|uniref:cytokine-like nuclear factor N-PAC isoform X2 n=1 Tax=Centruroides vittatus TaxID=120091 RepID=UPI00350FDEAC